MLDVYEMHLSANPITNSVTDRVAHSIANSVSPDAGTNQAPNSIAPNATSNASRPNTGTNSISYRLCASQAGRLHTELVPYLCHARRMLPRASLRAAGAAWMQSGQKDGQSDALPNCVAHTFPDCSSVVGSNATPNFVAHSFTDCASNRTSNEHPNIHAKSNADTQPKQLSVTHSNCVAVKCSIAHTIARSDFSTNPPAPYERANPPAPYERAHRKTAHSRHDGVAGAAGQHHCTNSPAINQPISKPNTESGTNSAKLVLDGVWLVQAVCWQWWLLPGFNVHNFAQVCGSGSGAELHCGLELYCDLTPRWP